jgi:hypothetical protein
MSITAKGRIVKQSRGPRVSPTHRRRLTKWAVLLCQVKALKEAIRQAEKEGALDPNAASDAGEALALCQDDIVRGVPTD